MKKHIYRVKQLADQTFLRAEKSNTLSDEELQIAEKKVEYFRNVFTAVNKKLPPSGQNPDLDKRVKKSLEHQLGSIFLDNSKTSDYPECVLLQDILREAGVIEKQLAKEFSEHECKLEEMVSNPVHTLVDNDFPNILKQRRNLAKYTLDKDSASSRYNATKKENLKDDMEEADYKVEQCRDILATDMFTLISRETEFATYILQILKLQRAYHEGALNTLKTVIPDLERKIGDSSTKKVFGVPLQEHLRVTNKRIAYPLEICITSLMELGLSEEGLFRLAGSSSKIKKLKASIDSGCFSMLIPEYRDVHVIASVLKTYLRELPEPLLTYELHDDWVQILGYAEQHRLEYVRKLLKRLPKENFENLTYLIQFLAKLAEKTSFNKMTSSNLAIVISPNLLWSVPKDVTMENCAAINVLLELFIKEVNTLFNENVSQYVTPLNMFLEEDRPLKNEVEYHNDLNRSTESIAIESPKPNTRKKKAPPVPPNNLGKLEHDMSLQTASILSSYPSGSSTLNRPKPKDNKIRSTVGTNMSDIFRTSKTAFENNCTKTTKENVEPKAMEILNNAKNIDTVKQHTTEKFHAVRPAPTQPSSGMPNSLDDKNFKTTAVYTVNNTSECNSTNNSLVKPVAAPRMSIDPEKAALKRTSSTRSVLPSHEFVPSQLPEKPFDIQLRNLDGHVNKPEIPARPASLQKRASFELNLDVQKTQCSVYNVANKHQPSYINIHNKSEKFQLGHDNQISEKEKFLGHNPAETLLHIDTNNTLADHESLPSLPTEDPIIRLPPKHLNLKLSERPAHVQSESCKSLVTKSIEKLNETAEGIVSKKSSHSRTKSDGSLIDFANDISAIKMTLQSPSSPRSLNKPTQPPPPPPVLAKAKPESDSTDL